MVKMARMGKAITPKTGSGVPGDSARARVNEAQGQKVTDTPGSVVGKSTMQAAAPVGVATGDNIVMPVDHPNATTTRTVTKGGTL